MSEISHTLTNEAVPRTEATITVRVIKSFEYRTERSLVLHKLNLEATTVGGLKEIVRQAVQTGPAWRPYRNAVLDTLKLYTKAHGAKTTNLIINLDHDDWLLEDDDKILADVGLENETEVSFFSRKAYDGFKLSPEVRWDVTS
ncbi:cytoplasmic protein [Boletus reticuloceps]|uniref:Cytoplasmic protein n=1 Tax=Boletus reticuloceps TaxID=495285 RepID=A0A8I3AA94_9AGAM|nr:cytoplasmic protein [Boletus reticuloceps]